MARLPTPGGDNNDWGDILNAYLEVSLSNSGTLNNNVVGTNQIQNNAVTNAQLDSAIQSAITKANSAIQSVNSKTGSAVTLNAGDVSAVATSQLGAANGVATLDSGTHLTAAQLPTSVVYGNGLRSIGSFNGSTDGTVINAALTALGGPGTVLLPAGTAAIDTTILLGAGQALIGIGWGTVLQAKNNLNADMIALSSPNSVGVFINDLVIDGNKTNNTSGNGISIVMTGNTLNTSTAANGATLKDLWIRNCAGDAVSSVNGTNGIINVLHNVNAYWNAGNGFTIQSSDIECTSCYAEKNGLAGWVVGPTAGFGHFSNCGGSDSGQVTASAGYGWKIVSSRCTFSACFAQDNTMHGFFNSGSGAVDNLFSGCYADTNGWNNASANAAGFYIDNATIRTDIIGCRSLDRLSGGSRFQAYGYYITGNADYVNITSTAYNNILGGITNVSSGTHNVTGTTSNIIASLPVRGWNQPTGTLGASIYDRSQVVVATIAALTSGKIYLVRIPVQGGDVISNVCWSTGTTAGSGLTHRWAALYDTSYNKLAVSTDDTSASWTASTEQAFPVSYTVPSGVNAVYAALVVVGTTVPTLAGQQFMDTGVAGNAPPVVINSNAGLTDPSTAPNTLGAPASSTKTGYCRLT